MQSSAGDNEGDGLVCLRMLRISTDLNDCEKLLEAGTQGGIIKSYLHEQDG